MEEKKPVEMVRLPKQEQYFDREEIFGRDVTSVFPNQGRQEAEEAAQSVAAALGAKKFISETELAEIKNTRGGTVEDGVVAADKSLAEQLAENKAKKEADFQEVWRKMKEGTQRPIDTEEAEFLDSILQQRAQRERAATQEEQQELEAFREALKQRTVAAPASRPVGPSTQDEALIPTVPERPRPAVKPAVKPTIRPVIKAIIKPVRKGSGGGAAGQASTSGQGEGRSTGAGAGAKEELKRGGGQEGGPDAKRRRGDDGEEGAEDSESGGEGSGEGAGLAGLLGGYSSDSDAD